MYGEDDSMKGEIEEAEERIVAKVMSRMGVIKPSEEETPLVKQSVKKAVAKPKRVVVVEEESSSEEEDESNGE
jgi:TPP-dependent indolepyruvate ferredoxin oxidoreductase alpha subunit